MEVLGKPFLRTDQYKTRPSTKTFVVHGSETSADQDIGVAEIREWHIKERGFKDVGYHYVIRRDGRIELGRPTWAVPAAVSGSNNEIVAVCLVGGGVSARKADGTYTDKPNYTDEQYTSLEEILSSLFRVYPCVERGIEAVKGHREYKECQDEKKLCPFFDVPTWWKKRMKAVLKDCP